MARRILRRDAIRAGLAAIGGPVAMGFAPPPVREVRAFRLAETAGLRRFGYPVHTVVPDAAGGRHYRLVRDGRPIPAQFREFEGPDGRPSVALDFVASPGPQESARYEVQFGSAVDAGPEPREGLTIHEREGRFVVSSGVSTRYELDKDSPRFLRDVGGPRLGFLREAGGLIRVRKKGEAEDATGGGAGRLGLVVARHGPVAVGLQSARPAAPDAPLGLRVTIPSSKSWVEVVASVDDSPGAVAGLELDLALLIEGSPTLVDFGAGSTVYGQIQGTERMELVAGRAVGEGGPAPGPGWVVRKGSGAALPVTAASTAGSRREAEGWAHVMDARRCTAVAVAGFGREDARDRIVVQADGRVRIVRDFAVSDGEPSRGPKSLTFWLHFVPMPVQVGAATSPQAILAPLRVDWDRPPGP